MQKWMSVGRYQPPLPGAYEIQISPFVGNQHPYFYARWDGGKWLASMVNGEIELLFVKRWRGPTPTQAENELVNALMLQARLCHYTQLMQKQMHKAAARAMMNRANTAKSAVSMPVAWVQFVLVMNHRMQLLLQKSGCGVPHVAFSGGQASASAAVSPLRQPATCLHANSERAGRSDCGGFEFMQCHTCGLEWKKQVVK